MSCKIDLDEVIIDVNFKPYNFTFQENSIYDFHFDFESQQLFLKDKTSIKIINEDSYQKYLYLKYKLNSISNKTN